MAHVLAISLTTPLSLASLWMAPFREPKFESLRKSQNDEWTFVSEKRAMVHRETPSIQGLFNEKYKIQALRHCSNARSFFFSRPWAHQTREPTAELSSMDFFLDRPKSLAFTALDHALPPNVIHVSDFAQTTRRDAHVNLPAPPVGLCCIFNGVETSTYR